jgi:hypothetical protein
MNVGEMCQLVGKKRIKEVGDVVEQWPKGCYSRAVLECQNHEKVL